MNVCLDRMFVAVLFTSERSDHVRYVDEGDLVELCKWTVDLGSLPTFQQHASSQAAAMGHGFYTEFELGLEVDSAEVRGVCSDGFSMTWLPAAIAATSGIRARLTG